jgi:hypothetical protein
MSASLLLQKKYPSQYPEDAVKVLNAMSFSNGKDIMIMGSSSLQSQKYAGDYDAYEIVKVSFPTKEKALHHLAQGLPIHHTQSVQDEERLHR